jgi:ABC-type glycerol-3-phosphate transport system substrate-binding protein
MIVPMKLAQKRILLSLLVMAMLAVTTACSSLKVSANSNALSFTYSTFNFSGASWEKVKSYCAARNKQAKHIVTDCGFWMCTSQVECTD